MSNDKMRIVVMGCGGSGGVPYAGNIWGKCDPNNPKNYRLRPSIYIQKGDTKIVIDTGPDFRQQINATKHEGKLDAVLYTHEHFDHVNGIDDLRAFFVRYDKKPIDVYADAEVMKNLQKRFDYIFSALRPEYPAMAQGHILSEDVTIIGDLEVVKFSQIHGSMMTTGFRIGDFAYCTDVNDLPPESLSKLVGIKTWIVGSYPSNEGAYNHAGLDQVNRWIDQLKPDMTYLTHLTATADYDELCGRLPAHIRPAYDGLEISL